MESPVLLLILALSIADFRWLQPEFVQNFRVFCLLNAFQNVDHFPRIPSHIWSVSTIILSGLHSLNHPESLLNHSNNFRGRKSKSELKLDSDSLIFSLGHCECNGSHSTQAQSMTSHCRLTSPMVEWLFTDEQWGLPWLGDKLHLGHVTGSRDIQNGWIHSEKTSYG
jgi:hypothetical protein